MAVVTIDERGRLTIPREMEPKKGKAVVIPAGSFFVVIPVPVDPYKFAGSWLSTEHTVKELKVIAEKRAAEDAVGRAKRRRQL